MMENSVNGRKRFLINDGKFLQWQKALSHKLRKIQSMAGSVLINDEKFCQRWEALSHKRWKIPSMAEKNYLINYGKFH